MIGKIDHDSTIKEPLPIEKLEPFPAKNHDSMLPKIDCDSTIGILYDQFTIELAFKKIHIYSQVPEFHHWHNNKIPTSTKNNISRGEDLTNLQN